MTEVEVTAKYEILPYLESSLVVINTLRAWSTDVNTTLVKLLEGTQH